MSSHFRREYLIRLPLPLAQLYARARNAKDGRARHDNCFYVFESMIKIAGTPMIAAYAAERRRGAERVAALDRLLVQLALPSLGQFVGILRETARYYGSRDDADSHPLGHVWKQINTKRNDLEGMLALYCRIKNGPEGQPAGDKSCSILQLLDALVTYRNAVIGHGAGRFESFYEEVMGPLMFPAINDVLEEGVWDMLGPPGSCLALLERISSEVDGRAEVDVRELVGLQSERSSPVSLDETAREQFRPGELAVLWPGHDTPLMLDPLLLYQDTQIAEDVQVLNRDRNGKQAEYLSYATGEATRNAELSPALNAFLELVRPVEGTGSGRPRPARQPDGQSEDPSDRQPRGQTELPSGAAAADDTEETPYQVLTELGNSGMGVVSLARQTSLGRLVALKMLPPELLKNEAAVAEFRREMRALVNCEHPNVAKAIACGTLPGGVPYYAMEFIPGTDLEHLWRELARNHSDDGIAELTSRHWSSALKTCCEKLRQRRLKRVTEAWSAQSADGARAGSGASTSEEIDELHREPKYPDADDEPGGYVRRIVGIVFEAAQALEAIHEYGVIHCDITPCNLTVTPDADRVVIMDFGLANKQSHIAAGSRADSTRKSPRYKAPEQLQGDGRQVGPHTDVRGLGITLWELLTRRRLFEECGDNAALKQTVLERDVPLLRSIDPGFDRDLESIVARATARDPENRMGTASELLMALDAYLQADTHDVGMTATARAGIARTFQELHSSLGGLLLEAVDAMGNVSDAAQARIELLQRAAESYARFAGESAGVPELQDHAAFSSLSLGDVHARLDDWESAEAAFSAAVQMFEQLTVRDPDQLSFRIGELSSRLRLASALAHTGRTDAASAGLDDVERALRPLLQSQPDDADLQRVQQDLTAQRESVRV